MTKPPFILENLAVLTLTPLLAVTVVPLYGFYVGYDGFEWLMFVLFLLATGFSVTGGYHRLWSHRSYEAHALVRLFYAIWGACAVQNSVINWASDHRRHHLHVDDNDLDPYSAKRGFWFSHIGWILRDYDANAGDFSNVQDLLKDPILQWQRKYYLALVFATNFGLPLLIGYLHGKLWGTLLLAGILRLVVNHHLTFLINSLSHIWGIRPYSESNSSRDNPLIAIFTYGEGNHNYHHRFQYDYRNGGEWWHFDPTKWIIKMGSWVGLTHKLKQASTLQIEKVKLNVQFQRAASKLESESGQEAFRHRLEQQFQRCLGVLNEWAQIKQRYEGSKRQSALKSMQNLELRQRYLELKQDFKEQRKQWRLLTGKLSSI